MYKRQSVANAERVMNVAKIVTDTYREGNDVVVVVSAQGDTTDDLIDKAPRVINTSMFLSFRMFSISSFLHILFSLFVKEFKYTFCCCGSRLQQVGDLRDL